MQDAAWLFLCLKVYQIALIGVDDFRILSLADAFKIIAVALMHVAVNHVAGMKAVNDGIKRFKTLVGQVIFVAIAPRRRMGQQDVNTAVPPDFQKQFLIAEAHFPLGILMVTGIVFHTAAKTQNPNAVYNVEITVDAGASAGRCRFVERIVIPVHIIDRDVRECGQKRQIGRF